jgi:4a-hydroxytetrahydrobiopterin dehydratase
MALVNESCVACETGEGKLTPAEVTELLGTVDGWDIDEGSLAKRWKFNNFKQSLNFVDQVGALAEVENHHPDISFGWGYASVRLTTHSVEGLTRNDFIVAAKIDGIAKA